MSRRLLLASLCTFLVLLSFRPREAGALHFYLEGGQQKCFIEDLAQGTLVNGDYKSEEWDDQKQTFVKNHVVGMQVVVEELPQRHRIVNQKGASDGKFTFTSSESGEHAICMSTNTTGWFSNKKTRVFLDMHIGDAETYGDVDHEETLTELVSRVRDLNLKILDIRREQGYQRENEAIFRNQSEHTNARAVYYTLMQLIVIGITGVWQMRHLKGFFVSKKLV